MSDIVLSAATRNSLLAAQNTASLLNTTQNHLATGKKVTSALDNPLNFFTAQSLDNRSSDLSNLLDGISNGIQTIQAASTGITNIQKLVDSAKSTATQALAVKNTASSSASAATAATFVAGKSVKAGALAVTGGNTDGTIDFSGSNRASFSVTDALGKSTTIDLKASSLSGKVQDLTHVTDDEILTQINAQLNDAPGVDADVTASKGLDGRLVFTSDATGSDASITVVQATAANNTVDIGFGSGAITSATVTGVDATDGSTKARATGTAQAALNSTGAGIAGASAGLTIQLGTGAVKTISFTGTAQKGAALVTQINAQLNNDTSLAGKVTASWDDTNNKLTIRTTASGSDQKLTVSGTGTVDVGFGVAATPGTVVATGAGATTGAATAQRASLASQFNDLLTQITQLSQDASYNGTNLLYRAGKDPKENTLHLQFNENNSSSLDIKGVKFDSTGLGLTSVSSGFSSDDDINTALSQLTNASTTLRAQASTFGSNLTVVQNRQDFAKSLINTLQTGSSNLVNADLNEEAANSQALTTRQSLAISALSLANTSQQSVLQLLR